MKKLAILEETYNKWLWKVHRYLGHIEIEQRQNVWYYFGSKRIEKLGSSINNYCFELGYHEFQRKLSAFALLYIKNTLEQSLRINLVWNHQNLNYELEPITITYDGQFFQKIKLVSLLT